MLMAHREIRCNCSSRPKVDNRYQLRRLRFFHAAKINESLRNNEDLMKHATAPKLPFDLPKQTMHRITDTSSVTYLGLSCSQLALNVTWTCSNELPAKSTNLSPVPFDRISTAVTSEDQRKCYSASTDIDLSPNHWNRDVPMLIKGIVAIYKK